MKKLIVCESCDVEYTIQYDMEEKYYNITYCPFCGKELIDNDEDIMYDEEYYDSDD